VASAAAAATIGLGCEVLGEGVASPATTDGAGVAVGVELASAATTTIVPNMIECSRQK